MGPPYLGKPKVPGKKVLGKRHYWRCFSRREERKNNANSRTDQRKGLRGTQTPVLGNAIFVEESDKGKSVWEFGGGGSEKEEEGGERKDWRSWPTFRMGGVPFLVKVKVERDPFLLGH